MTRAGGGEVRVGNAGRDAGAGFDQSPVAAAGGRASSPFPAWRPHVFRRDGFRQECRCCIQLSLSIGDAPSAVNRRRLAGRTRECSASAGTSADDRAKSQLQSLLDRARVSQSGVSSRSANVSQASMRPDSSPRRSHRTRCRRAVRERLGNDAALCLPLQPVVADRRGGAQPFFDVAGLEQSAAARHSGPRRRRSSRPAVPGAPTAALASTSDARSRALSHSRSRQPSSVCTWWPTSWATT